MTAAFDAPVAGALFAIEFVLKSSRLGLDRLSTSTVFVATSVAAGVEGFLRSQVSWGPARACWVPSPSLARLGSVQVVAVAGM